MIKLYMLLVLLVSTSGNLFAQEKGETKEEKTFGTDKLYVKRRFFINFDKENKLQIEVGNINDLKYLNADSLFRIFIKEMEPLKDSLVDDQTTKRIDYIISSSKSKKIRFIRTYPKGSNFFIYKENLTSLKTEQDTINLVVFITKPVSNKRSFDQNDHFIHFTFLVNQYSELNQYVDGRINSSIAELNEDPNKQWVSSGPWKGYYLKNNKAITANQPRGMAGGPGDFMSLSATVNVENYKSYFVPSFSLGTKLVLSHSNFKREISLIWDPKFLFGTNAQGNLRTYRNDFISLTFGHGPIKDNDARKESYLLTFLSFGYLVNREGNYFDKNTWRIGAGILSLFEGKTKIEPALYFNHFFKGVTPSLRLIESF